MADTTPANAPVDSGTILTAAAKKVLEAIDRPREREVVERRFGLNGTKETLEQVGETMGITRERVRQIEKATLVRAKLSLDNGKNPDFTAAETELVKVLHELGRAAPTVALAKQLFGEDSQIARGTITFLADLSDKMVSLSENDRYFPAVALSQAKDSKALRAAVDELVDLLKNHGEAVSVDQFFALVANLKHAKFEHPTEVTALASLSKKVATLDGMWGLDKWPLVNPKNIRDKIYVIMKKNGQPMHFSDIAKSVKSEAFSRNNVTDQAIHNELIKDERCILIGRGIYALAEWGYKKGSIIEVVEEVLKQESPLHREEVVRRVLKVRQVREATILLNLQNSPRIKRVAKAQYAYVAEAAPEPVAAK